MTDKRERLGQQYGPGDKFGIKKKKKKEMTQYCSQHKAEDVQRDREWLP